MKRFEYRITRSGRYRIYDRVKNCYIGVTIQSKSIVIHKLNKLNDACDGIENEYSDFVRIE